MPCKEPAEIRWLPKPKSVRRRKGTFRLPDVSTLELSSSAKGLVDLIKQDGAGAPFQWTVSVVDKPGFFFRIVPEGGEYPRRPASNVLKAEHYRLQVGLKGISAQASDLRGLLYAWQTLRQVWREQQRDLPCMTLSDGPDIPWRIYHLDLKGTRRDVANLYRLVERLSELRINALLVEYEDYLVLDRHPTLAVKSALDRKTLSDWLAYVDQFGIEVIPLVQTLGHWQYVLTHPDYAHLRELPDETTDGCPTHPETWTLVKDFLDEMIELHPKAPFIHVGLDETALLGRCPRCKKALDGRPPIVLHIEWLNKVTDYVRSKGCVPLAWSDKLLSEVDGPHEKELSRIHPGTMFTNWDYRSIGPVSPSLMLQGHHVSQQWLQRPRDFISVWPLLGFGEKSGVIEDLPSDLRQRAEERYAHAGDPSWIRNFSESARLKAMGYEAFGVAGLRVSYHGPVAPRFLTAQYNVMAWAEAARGHHLQGIIGSSWSRGHSWAACNAHPELDWYAIATLSQACWSGLQPKDLPDFDRRFAFQFFGIDEEGLGDALALFHRSTQRADHVMDNFTYWVEKKLFSLRSRVKHNEDVMDLLCASAQLQTLLLELDFSLLEGAYFRALWERVPPDYKKQMLSRVQANLDKAKLRLDELKALYRKSLVEEDADELAETQLRFRMEQVSDMLVRLQ